MRNRVMMLAAVLGLSSIAQANTLPWVTNTEAAQPSSPSSFLRVSGTAAGGLLGGAALGLGLGALGWLAAGANPCLECGGRGIVPYTMGAIGALSGISLATYGTANWLGGQGRLLPTFGGVLAGALTGGLIGTLAIGLTWQNPSLGPPIQTLSYVLMGAAPVVGGILFYEGSNRADGSAQAEQISPAIAVSPQGFAASIRVRF